MRLSEINGEKLSNINIDPETETVIFLFRYAKLFVGPSVLIEMPHQNYCNLISILITLAEKEVKFTVLDGRELLIKTDSHTIRMYYDSPYEELNYSINGSPQQPIF